MIASRVTPPAEEEGADMDGANLDGAEWVGGAVDLNCLDLNCTSLRLTVVAFMAHITWKWSKIGKETEKWRKILVIAEGNMSLSWVAISLYISMMERMK